MADLLNLGFEAAAGGVFGILGTALGRVAGYFERGQSFRQEQMRWDHELKLHELQMRAKAQETEMELAIAAQQGSWSGLTESLKADAAIGQGSPWVINTLRLVRPTLTLLLWCITILIFALGRDASIVEAVIFAATAATLWWFGDRAPKPAGNFYQR